MLIIRITTSTSDGEQEKWDADAVILAVGVRALQNIVQGSPSLAAEPSFSGELLLIACFKHTQGALSLSRVACGFDATGCPVSLASHMPSLLFLLLCAQV